MNIQETIRRILRENDNKIHSSFLRRIDMDQFKKELDRGKVYLFYDSNSLEEFKWKLVVATLENYMFYGYNIDIDTSEDYVVETIKTLVDIFDDELTFMYKVLKNTIG